MADEDNVKWMTNEVQVCLECRRSTRHDIGVKYVDGKEVNVKSCLRCKTETTIE